MVDDEPAARQMISAAMKLAQLKITCADDPEMALSVLGDNQFDLIFLDVNMPHCSGFDLCTKIRQTRGAPADAGGVPDRDEYVSEPGAGESERGK